MRNVFRRLTFPTLVLSAVNLIPTEAQAAPILWTLQGVTFGGANTATGSFVFDADTLAYSDVAITTGTLVNRSIPAR